MYLKAIDTCHTRLRKKMTEEETPGKSSKTWYLPHHPLFYPKKADKIRAVVDVTF